MAQLLIDALAGGMSNIENQSAIQSILDSQPAVETTNVQEDEDVFQCGKCKKQFTQLSMFVTHKHTRCTPAGAGGLSVVSRPAPAPATLQPTSLLPGLVGTQLGGAFASPVSQALQRPHMTQSVAPLSQLPPSVVLTDDQMLISDLGQTVQNGILQGSTLHLTGNTVQATGPFLSQVTQLTPRVSVNNNNVAILSPVQPSSSSLVQSSGSAFTSAVSMGGLQPTQQITIATALPDKPATIQHIIKPSPTKAGRKSAQATAINSGTGLDDADLQSRRRSRLGGTGVGGSAEDAGKKRLACTYCGKVFTKNFDLQQHVRSHTGEKPFQCVVCGRAFAQKSNVKKHMATHKVWPTGPGSTLPSQPPALLVPLEEQEEAEKQLEQDTHPQVVEPLPPAQLQQVPPPPLIEVTEEQSHVLDTGEDKPGGGEVDGEDEKEGEQPQNYKLKVVIDNSYLCQYCPEKFKSYYGLKSHMVKHKNVQVYKCVVKSCAQVFHDLDSFLEHMGNHTEDLTYRCHQCNKLFSTLYELGVHQYTHSLYQHPTNKPGPRHFQCNKCLNKYATPEALEHHMNTTDHKFPCPHCQKNFACERFLRRHLASHGTEGLFECHICQKTFKTEHYLKNHLLIHTGEKPFECEECGASFNRKDKLKRHNLIHDTRIRYRCPFNTVSGCDKEFNRPDKLKAHIIIHSGVRPYQCQICGKDFARKPHLKEHERAHKQDHPYKCTKCNRGFFRPKTFKEHRCETLRGQPIKKRVFQPRKLKRKPGRPRKHPVVQKSVTTNITTTTTKNNNASGQKTIVINPGNKNENRVIIESVVDGTDKSALVGAIEIKEMPLTKMENTVEEDITASTEADVNAVTVDHSHDMSDNKAFKTSNSDLPINATFSSLTATEPVAVSEENVALTGEEPFLVVQNLKPKKMKQECYVKAPPATLVPASMVEQYVTVHLTSTGQGDASEIQAQLIPAGDLAGQLQFSTSALQSAQVQISPATYSTAGPFHPIQIIEGQPVTLTVSQNDQLSALGVGGETNVIDIPVDIVTVSDERALVCTQEVPSTGDTGEQTYMIEDYSTGEGDAVLQGSENLINASVEILGSDHVTSIATLEN